MYMAFQFEVLHFENLGRNFPGEWLSADLGVVLSDNARAQLRHEYKRKMDEDNVQVKKQRQAVKLNKASQDKHSPEQDRDKRDRDKRYTDKRETDKRETDKRETNKRERDKRGRDKRDRDKRDRDKRDKRDRDKKR
jgi:hypothetical protein